MLIDSELLDTLDKAHGGDKEAMFAIAYHYLNGEKVPKERVKAREFLKQLVDDEDKDLYTFEYGSIYTSVADLFYADNHYKKANEYYLKAKDFILETYEQDYASELIEELEIETLIAETTNNL